MEVTIIPDSFDPEVYNTYVNHPLQTWEWGMARKEMGIDILRIQNKNRAYQLTFHKIPYTNYKIGYLPRSPMPDIKTLDFLYDYALRHNVIFIKIEPYEIKNSKPSDVPLFNETKGYSIKQSPHGLFPEWSMMLNLKDTEETLLKNMKPKTRYNIKLAQKKGVEVREESNEKGFQIFSELYFETCRRQKYHGHTPHYHKIIWEHMKKSQAHILVAYYQNIPLAAYELFYLKKKLYYPYGGTSELHRNVMAANLIMWEAIRLGKRLGAESFDMWGSLAQNYPADHPWAGFTRFKEGYGAKFVQFVGSYDLIINPLQYSLYNILHAARTAFLSMF